MAFVEGNKGGWEQRTVHPNVVNFDSRSPCSAMETGMEEDDSASEILRDRFRLSTISIAEAEAKRSGMEISEPVMTCVADLAFKYTTEQLAKDLELFVQHAGRKSVTTEDVILSAHRNEHLAATLTSICNDLKTKEPQSERKRKKASKKEDRDRDAVHITDA